ncbi:MAG: hypothetical protein CMF12_08615 [Idiomarina sp.]|nr:hypothetical protein [Idiomarina sp.]|tara:strand:+ start:1056 stop:1247 length:192 start_codon:yes stop_codon:yes gene_type:complete
MHKTLAVLAGKCESQENRQILIDASQKLENGEQAIRILKSLCYSKRLTPGQWNKAFIFLRSIE